MSSIHFWCPHCTQLHADDAYWQVGGVVVCRTTWEDMTLGRLPTFDEFDARRRKRVIAKIHQAICNHSWLRVVGFQRLERCARCKLVRAQPEVERTPQAYRIHPIDGYDGVWIDWDGEAWLGTANDSWVALAQDAEGEMLAAPDGWQERVVEELG